jgi:plasmid stabilization system protein ParE
MAGEPIFAPEALQDVEEAYNWYENRRIGLGEEFLGCLDACIRTICRTPELHAKVYEGYRRALVQRFPYAIFYEFIEKKIFVYAIFHAARDPQKWRDRLT